MSNGLNNYGTILGFTRKNPTTPAVPGQPLTTQKALADNVTTEQLTNPGKTLTSQGAQYNNKVSENLNNPGANLTDFGNTYDATLRKSLASGVAPGAQNLEAQAQRQNALNTNRQTNQTAESLASQGIRPGTAAFSRAQAVTNAGVESQNQARTNQVDQNSVASYNDLLAKSLGREGDAVNRQNTAMNQSLGIENAAKGVQTAGQNNANTIETNANAGRIENNTTNTALINTVTDPKAQTILRGVANAGGDVQAAYNQMFGISQTGNTIGGATAGTLIPEAQSLSPGNAEVAATTDKVKAYNPPNPGEDPAAYDARIQKMVSDIGNKTFASQTAPLDQGVKDRAATDIKEKLNTLGNNQFLASADFEEAKKQGIVKQFTEATIPKGSGVNDFLRENPSGIIQLGGKQYKVISGRSPTTSFTTTGQPRHTDEVQVQDENGNVKWVYNGKINDKNEPSMNQSDYWGFG